MSSKLLYLMIRGLVELTRKRLQGKLRMLPLLDRRDEQISSSSSGRKIEIRGQESLRMRRLSRLKGQQQDFIRRLNATTVAFKEEVVKLEKENESHVAELLEVQKTLDGLEMQL